MAISASWSPAAYPEIHVMDATSDRSWRLLDLWSQLISASDEEDRTRLYRRAIAREDFLAAPTEDLDQDAVMVKLGLRARSARRPGQS